MNLNGEHLFLIGWGIIFCALVFNVAETAHFGWNIRAYTKAEMICDYIASFLLMIGLFTVMYSTFFYGRQ